MTAIKRRLIEILPGLIVVLFLIAAPYLVGSVITSLLTKIIIFALLAMALDVAFGYTGLWSFCHAAIFGVAGYTVGLFIEYSKITSFWIIAPSAVLAATVVSVFFALVSLRVSGLFFLIITFALGQMVYSSTLAWNDWTHGFEGMSGIPYPDIGFSLSPTGYYYFSFIVFLICIYVLNRIIKSPFGLSLQGIRESETRMRCLGYKIWFHKFLVFVITGFFSGIAGVLYTYYNGIITPSDVGFVASGLIMIIIIMGGTGTFWGAFLGGFIIFFLNYYVSSLLPDRWPIILGIVFVGAALIARNGIFPILNHSWEKLKALWQS
jgi:branched-chain amino acid transport system permease protein